MMSLYDKASLIMTPSGVKPAKIYSKKPFNANGDFTFDRNSTATRLNKDGYIETVATDTPRLDYPLIDGVVQDCPSLLLEPTRTNLITYSDINTAWNQQANLTNSLNDDVLAPDGTLNGWKSSRNINTSGYTYMTALSLAVNTEYTVSLWLKANDLTKCNQIQLTFHPNSFGSTTSLLDFEKESISSSGKLEKYPNGWYRISSTATTNATIGYFDIGLQPYLNGTSSWGGQDGDVMFYAYGTQVEAGSYATSYIPTSGSAVTRAAETANGAGTSDDFNDSEGVLYAEISALADDGTNRYISISDGSNNNRVQFIYSSDSNKIIGGVVSGNSGQCAFYLENIDTTLNRKLALKYKQNDFSFWSNGFEIGTDTSGIAPTVLDTLEFRRGNGTSDFYGKTKELSVFKTALTDSELESLTSWDSFSDMATGQLYSIK